MLKSGVAGFRITIVALSALVLAGCSAAPADAAAEAGRGVVTNAAELSRAIERSTGHTTIRLAPGSYGTLKIARLPAGIKITLKSADPARLAAFDQIAINGISGLTLSDISVACTPTAKPCATYLVAVTDAKDVSLQNLRITGMGGMERGRQYAIFIRGSSNIEVTGSRIAQTRYGIGMLNDKSVRIVGNEIHDLQTDGVRGGGIDDLLIANNVIGRFTPKEKEHPDGIQLWSTRQAEPGKRIVIRDNLIVRDGGGIVQGIFVRDTHNKLPFEDVTIRGNLVIGAMYNGIAVSGATRGSISDNLVVAYPDMKSWISVRRATDVEFSGNRAMLLLLQENKLAANRNNSQIRRYRAGDISEIPGWLNKRPEIDQTRPYVSSLLEAANKK